MAGSFNHIVDEKGGFSLKTIENGGDAAEALEECFDLVHKLTDGHLSRVNSALDALGYAQIETGSPAPRRRFK